MNPSCMKIRLITFLSFLLFAPVAGQPGSERSARLEKKAARRSAFIPDFFSEWHHMGAVRIDSIQVNREKMTLDYYFNPATIQIPARMDWIENLHNELSVKLRGTFRDYRINLWALNRLLEEYIPNAFRDASLPPDTLRISKAFTGPPLVTTASRKMVNKGLAGNHIALWPSHGLFFDQQLDRWQWQRARLWQTVEDIFPWSFTSEYLIPMLENAGANVLIPRERDTQVHEVIVDNDFSTGNSQLLTNGDDWKFIDYTGFKWADTLLQGQNPFEPGTSISHVTFPGDSSAITYVPDIPSSGEYAVYVSYAKTPRCINNTHYTVRYSGGQAEFFVNQCMGAGTWIYLGTFHFIKGSHSSSGSVKVSAPDSEGILSTDAIRFGGGMGNVARKPGREVLAKQRSVNDGMIADVNIPKDTVAYVYKVSGKPRWMEGSRYYLQYAGMPDSLTYNLNDGKNDYNDDYMSRPEWVNYLIGASRPQYSDKYRNGLGIPVDLSLAFHTDAGVTWGDTVIGTLGIFSTVRNNGLFPDGRSKLSSRDLTDLIQTQLVEDIRKTIDPRWTRRALWDREYSEAWRPVVPAVLLELLSHQNLADMRYGLDPRFKFTAARAIYKGLLRYLANEQVREAVIQPLPPDHLAIEVLENKKIRLSWKDVDDPLEPSARAEGYRIYQRKNDEGFGQGIYTNANSYDVDLPEWGPIYSFKVTAVNSGGESFPGEILSVALLPGNEKPVLLVNAFDRICGPAFFDKGDMAGIAWWEDEGVPYKRDLSFTGHQYDFSRTSEWIHDDSQGWGASNADMETHAITGNTFDNTVIHGEALRDAGFSHVSVSDEAFEAMEINHGEYAALDVIFGEERGTTVFGKDSVMEFRLFTPGLIKAVSNFTVSGGPVFMSGAYIGTDMMENRDSSAIHFAADVLHYIWRTHHATSRGQLNTTEKGSGIFPENVQFNTEFNSALYRVESPDAIEPVGNGSFRICRYASGNTSAGIAYKGAYKTVVLGFPFETITDESSRGDVMEKIMKFLTYEIRNTQP